MPKKTTYDVFISYRRQGGAEKAELTKGELTKRGFRESRMFMDTRSITSGNYIESIIDALDKSGNVVVIITKGCFDNLPEDSTWVKEIEHALKTGKNIVPMYFDGISEVRIADMPENIHRLSFENAVMYVHQYADASFDRLASRLTKESVSMPKWSRWVIGAIAAGGLATGGYAVADHFSELKPGEVYVVDSSTSKSYHSSRDCATLKNAHHRIIKMDEQEAIQQGKNPCKRCYK